MRRLRYTLLPAIGWALLTWIIGGLLFVGAVYIDILLAWGVGVLTQFGALIVLVSVFVVRTRRLRTNQ